MLHTPDGGSDRVIALDMFKLSKHGRTWTLAALVPYAARLLIAERGQDAAGAKVTCASRSEAFDIARDCERRMERDSWR